MRTGTRQGLLTILFVGIVVCSNLLGNILVRMGMRSAAEQPSLSLMFYLQALANPWVLPGILLLILCLVSQLALLSWADLSFVAPVTSIGYVLTALAGKLLLHEPLSTPRWAAIFLIMAGVTLVSRTPLSTARGEGYGCRR